MASVVEVVQSKPRVGDITLKLSKSEAQDVQVMIDDWYRRNWSYDYNAKRDKNPTYAALKTALEGKASADVVKVNIYL